MGRTAMLRTLGAICAAAALATVATAAGGGAAAGARPAARCLVPGTRRTIDQLWRPDMAAAIAYARSRVGDIGFAVRTPDRFYGYRPGHDEWSASVVKATLLVTYLDSAPVRARALTSGPTTTRREATADAAVWGERRIDARDQTRFFPDIDADVGAGHRSHARRVLRSVIPPQRWGIGDLAVPSWKKSFRGGRGYETGLEDHHVVLLARGCARVAMAVLTMYDGSHPYGRATLKGIFAPLLRGFPTVARRHAAAPAVASRRVVIGHSVRGRPIVARVLGPGTAPRKLLLVGCIHGNECAGIAILSALARRPVPAGVQLWLVPEANPDGTAAGTRQNAHGVDLNRNFPYAWGRITDPTYYSGPRPASEPETRAAMALIRRIRPAVTIWYHQHMDLVDMAGGDRGVARRYAQVSGLSATCLGIFRGTATAWSNHLLPGTSAFVVELPAGPVQPEALTRHLRAIRAMEAGRRSGSRSSCAP